MDEHLHVLNPFSQSENHQGQILEHEAITDTGRQRTRRERLGEPGFDGDPGREYRPSECCAAHDCYG